MEAERGAIQSLIAISEDAYVYRPSITQVFDKLQTLSDADVTRILTFVMAETLSVHSPLMGSLGEAMSTDMRTHWHPDQIFFDLIRDKQLLSGMVGEDAGHDAAEANATATAKTQRAILTACLDGTRTPGDPNWTPRYMAFPMGSYRVDPSDGEETQSQQDDTERREAA